MSDLDEDTKRILAEEVSDDSKVSKPPSDEYKNKKQKEYKNDDSHVYDVHTSDDVDDRDW